MEEFAWSDEVRLRPWVQEPYWKSRVRTLVVGDSHYGDLSWSSPDFTNQIVIGSFDKPLAFFTKSAAVIKNKILRDPSERREFWLTVAFYNYLQTFAGASPGVSVSHERFEESGAAFREVLARIRPNLIIVLGHRLWGNMENLGAKQDSPLPDVGPDLRYTEVWQYPTSGKGTALAFHVKHPSRGFSFARFHPLYSEAIKRLTADGSISAQAR
jgi:hypothetical protein